MDTSVTPSVPIVRVPDPNSRTCLENLSTVTATTIASPSKRSRKQSSSVSGIKKQCTWELRTDPMDSSKSIWRSPLERADQLPTSFQSIETVDIVSRHEADFIDPTDSVIYGRPNGMRLFAPRLASSCKGSKARHFLRFV